MTSRIPEHCATCPWLQLDQKRLKEHELTQDEIIRKTTSDELEEVAELISAKLQEAPQELIDAFGELPDAKALAGMMRTMGGKALEGVSHHIETIQHDMEMMTSWCRGPIEMSATREGIVYSIGVCASQVLLDEDLNGSEPVRVRRYEIID